MVSIQKKNPKILCKKTKISKHSIPYKIENDMLSKQIEISSFVTVFLSISHTMNYPAQQTLKKCHFELNLNEKKSLKQAGI